MAMRGGMAEMIAILQSAHDDAGEDVMVPRELNGDFLWAGGNTLL